MKGAEINSGKSTTEPSQWIICTMVKPLAIADILIIPG
jgi:hypothetical protein